MYTYIAIALVAALLSAGGTWKVQDWRFNAREKQRIEAEAELHRMEAKRNDAAAVAHEKDKVRIETKYVEVVKEVPHEVEKLVYRNVCISPDGVRNINDLVDTYPSESAREVPEAGAPAERNGRGPVRVGPVDSQGVQHLR